MDAAISREIDVTSDASAVPCAVSWASIAAGAVSACAISLALFALGAGLGLSSISPWEDRGISATTFKVSSGIYIVLVSIMSSAIGGYMSARLRTRRVGLHTDEVFFRDTAHGFVTWAFATLITATVLASAVMQTVGGAASALASTASQAADRINPAQIFVDRLFRSSNLSATPAANNDPRAEVLRLWTSAMAENQSLSPEDRAYIAQVVSSQAAISEAEAEQRVNQVIAEAKDAADRARSNGAKLAFWITASLMFGAFAASWAAADGGRLRDGTWQDHRLMPRAESVRRPA